jgi:putative FmdB family regulatory protein
VPTYEYACTECDERLEAVQKFSDDPLTVCTTCGGKLRKVFAPVGIVFKGSGFYRTDSRNGSVPATAKSDGGGGESGSPASKGSGSETAGSTGSASGSSGSSVVGSGSSGAGGSDGAGKSSGAKSSGSGSAPAKVA